MPRSSRVTEMPQRPSPLAPPNLRTTSSSSDSDPLHHRSSRTDRSPKLSDGRSPRGSQSDPLKQKKLGSRIADLETQLGQAQDELKCLKNQLSSAEAAKKAAQEQLDKKSTKQKKKITEPVEIQEKHSTTTTETQEPNKKDIIDEYEASCDDVQKETDVFEVPTVEPNKAEPDKPADQDELDPKSVGLPAESPPAMFDELALKNEEISLLKAKLDERDGELAIVRQENENIKSQLNEKSLKISSAESKIGELNMRLGRADQELENSKINTLRLSEKLKATERAKEELENEMRRLRVQTEQWRKAADAAATVLAGEVEMNGRRISQRCGSMDNHYGNVLFRSNGGYGGSPGQIDDPDEAYGGGKRRGSGIRMFGDLWKKKGHK